MFLRFFFGWVGLRVGLCSGSPNLRERALGVYARFIAKGIRH